MAPYPAERVSFFQALAHGEGDGRAHNEQKRGSDDVREVEGVGRHGVPEPGRRIDDVGRPRAAEFIDEDHQEDRQPAKDIDGIDAHG